MATRHAASSAASGSTTERLRPLIRTVLFMGTLSLVVPALHGMASGVLPPGLSILLLLALLGGVAFGVGKSLQRSMAKKSAVRSVQELLRLFDDLSLLRPRAQAARAVLAGAPASDVERKSVQAVSQCLATLAVAVERAGPDGRREVLVHPVVGAWLRALASTPMPIAFDASQRGALTALQQEVGAVRGSLDAGSRALLERDAVMFRAESEDAVAIF